MDETLTKLLEKFPFLSYGKMGEDHYLGIIQNSDTQLISIYVIDMLPSEDMRRDFLSCGEEWWWQSNRKIPINIFLKEKFIPYRPYLKHFNRREFELLAGPSVSLQDSLARRVRKREVTLVRRMTD